VRSDVPHDLYRSIVEAAQEGVWVIDADGVTVYANPRLAALLGYEPHELIGRNAFELTLPEDRERALAALESRRRGEWSTAEWTLRGRNGDVEVQASASALFEGDRFAGAVSIVVDLTERKRVERALAESEARFRRLAENEQDIIYRYTRLPEPGWEYISPAIVQVLGYTPEECYANPSLAFEVVHADDRACLETAIAQDLEQPRVYRCIRKDGEIVWIEDRPKHVRDEDGRVVAVEGVARDITAQKRAEEAVRESEERFRAVFDNAIVPMIVFDDDLRYVNANPAACALVGLTLDEMLELRIPELSESPDEAERFKEALLKEGELGGQYRVKATDGTVHEVEFHAKANVQPGRHLAMSYEVTERKQLEAQLRQAQRMEAIGRLAGGVAHDFNNQLAAIKLYADLISANLDGDLDRARSELSGLQHVTDRAAALTRQLLAFGRRQILTPSALDLNDVVVLAETMLGRLIGEHITLDTEIEPELETIVADPGQLEQLIVNLVVNARDAISGNGTITIRTSNMDLDFAAGRGIATFQPGRYVVLTVADTGRGMDADTRARVFEPFFTTKATGEGTGLGLATSYGFVKQTGGYIWVDSEPGLGTTVTVAFPAAPDARPTRLARPETAHPGGGTETVLLVEDEDVVRAVTSEILETAGYSVLPAANGREACEVAAAHEGPIDVLLTDWIMPEMGGPEVAKRLRAERPEMRVIFMSGYAESDAVLDQLERGDTAFLPKPFSAAELARMLRHVIEGTRAEAQLAPPAPPA
jgi:two-component system, cell cycle sensor histidine kinase and response regulator CckA